MPHMVRIQVGHPVAPGEPAPTIAGCAKRVVMPGDLCWTPAKPELFAGNRGMDQAAPMLRRIIRQRVRPATTRTVLDPAQPARTSS